jgi:hypothetical protein
MSEDRIKWGETYDVTITAEDADGVAVPLTDEWQAAMRVTRGRVGGEIVAEPAVSIADGAAVASIDTGDAGWVAGAYRYDFRLTDPDGNDFWTEAVSLTLENRNAPNT